MLGKSIVLFILLTAVTTTQAANIWMEAELTYPIVGETVRINIIGSGFVAPAASCFAVSIGSITSDAGGSASNGALNPFFTQTPEFGTPGIGNDLITAISGTGAMGAFDGLANGAVIYSFDFLVPDAQTINIMMNDVTFTGAFGNAVPMESITGLTTRVVPEPMTIALLGLGGLFLRRKK